jgi:hypothetical protein
MGSNLICTVGRTLAVVLALAGALAPAARAESGLPAGAVVAFTPDTVCEKLPGGWKTYADADGRVIVGAMPGVPASGPQAALPVPPPLPPPPPGSPPPLALPPLPTPPINPPDYWAQNLTLTPGMAPRQALTGTGQIVVTAPTVTLQAGAKTDGATYRLYGYQLSPPKDPGSEALAVGYGPPGVVGKSPPDPVQVAPPFIALKMCVKM